MDNNENFDKNNSEKDNVSDNAENKYSQDDKILFEVSKGIETVDDTDDFNENIVITSYSIHYTKLYEPWLSFSINTATKPPTVIAT